VTFQISIDWERVRLELFRTERIPPADEESLKHIIHVYAGRSLAEAQGLVKPKVLSESRHITVSGSGAAVEGGFKISGKRLSTYLSGADEAVFFLVTVGSSLEEAASRWMKDSEPLYGYLLDRIGSLAAESLAAAAEDEIRRSEEKKGRSVSMRFSPGYCDWPVEEQRTLDEILNFSRIDVRLTEACMMVPKKSISGIIAVAGEDVFKKLVSSCDICENSGCDFRR